MPSKSEIAKVNAPADNAQRTKQYFCFGRPALLFDTTAKQILKIAEMSLFLNITLSF